LNIYYYHCLNLTFSSAQTLQVVKDYCYLSKHNHKIFLYGFYQNKNDLNDILNFIKDYPNIILFYSENRLIVKLKFLSAILKFKGSKIIVTRHYMKTKKALLFKKVATNCIVFQEMHEESFVYLFKSNVSKTQFDKVIRQLDGVIFTNRSQVIFYKKEFAKTPDFRYIVLPNGVEFEKFQKAVMCRNHILTYVGQFNRWKNIELIFAALSLLPEDFSLRIAGGKNDSASREQIDYLIKKYDLKERVEYKGFVKNSEIVERVLNCSNILLLPLGDNIQSKYLTSPMKLFEYMATKIPVVAVDYPSVSSILCEKGIIFLSQNDPENLSSEILNAVDTKNLDKQIDIMNRCAMKYSYENRSKKYNEFIKTFRSN